MKTLTIIGVLVVAALVGCAEVLTELAKPYYGPIVMQELTRDAVQLRVSPPWPPQSDINATAQWACAQHGNVAETPPYYSRCGSYLTPEYIRSQWCQRMDYFYSCIPELALPDQSSPPEG